MDRPVFTVLDCEHYVTRKDGQPYRQGRFLRPPRGLPLSFSPYACAADVYIPCHYWAENSPSFFTAAEAQDPAFSLKFIGDISCDIAGPYPLYPPSQHLVGPFYAWDAASGAEVPWAHPAVWASSP